MFQAQDFTEEQTMIAGFLQQLGKNFDESYFLQTTKRQEFPQSHWDAISAEGYLGINTPENLGGVGFSTADLTVFLQQAAEQNQLSLTLLNQLLCGEAIARFGSDIQKDKLLANIIAGEPCAWAVAETTQGRSLFEIQTQAAADGDGYLIDGVKNSVVGAGNAKQLLLAARTGAIDSTAPEKGLSLFMVPVESAGIAIQNRHINVRVTPDREEMSATGDLFSDLTFEGVKLSKDHLIGELGQGGEYLKILAAKQMLMIAAANLGWGERLLSKGVNYANERTIFKDPIATYQAVQHPLVIAKTKIEMAKLLVERAVEAFDAGAANNEEQFTFSSVAKYAAVEAAYSACDIVTQVHGGSGYDRDTGVVSLWPLIMISKLLPLNPQVILRNYGEKVLNLIGNTENNSFELSYETRTEFEVNMLNDLRDAINEARSAGGAPAMALGGVMAKLMGGDLSHYREHVMSDLGGALPVKLDFFRQFAVHGRENPAEGAGIPKFIVENSPVKFGLSAMAMAAISSGKGGRERIMSEYLPQMMQGKLFCYCITEPDAGTNTHKIKTVAKDMGDHYLLNGQKTYISAADTAHFMTVIARVEVDGEKQAVGTFVMEKATAGISMTQLDIAALGDPQFTVYFENVKLPKDALVGSKEATGNEGRGISEGVLYTLNLERIMVALGALQVGKESLDKALAKAKETNVFGYQACSEDEVKEKLAQLHITYQLNNLALKKATVAFDNKDDSKRIGMFANMAKYLTSIFADDAGQVALQLYGMEGLDKDGDDIGGLCKLGRVLRTVPINNEMVLNFLAENLMGLPKSYRV